MALKKIKLPNNTTVDINDARNVVIGDGADNIVTLTNAEYQALATKDPNTVYIVTDVNPGGGGGGGGDGTVTSVAMTVPTGLSVSGSPITTSGTLAVSLATGYEIPQSSAIVHTTGDESITGKKTFDSFDNVWDYDDGWSLKDALDEKGTYSKPSGGIPASDLAAGVIPTESTVSNWGFTKNAGTITGITMNGASKGTLGVVDLGTVITSHQDISGKADDSAVVHKTGNETITGNKVFLGNNNFQNTDFGGDIDLIGATLYNEEATGFGWIQDGNGDSVQDALDEKQKAITISTSEPTSSDGNNGDIWIVI